MSQNTAQTFIQEQFPVNIRSRLLPIIETALAVTNQLFDERQGIFSGPLSHNIRGRIYSFAIQKQFTPSYLNLPIKSDIVVVNKFGFSVPEIKTENSVLYLARSRNCAKFPQAKYIKKYACNNDLLGQQIEIKIDQVPLVLKEGPKCILLQYGIAYDKSISYCRLVLPDPTLQRVLGAVDLKSEFALLDTLQEPHREKLLVALKEEIALHLRKEYMNSGE